MRERDHVTLLLEGPHPTTDWAMVGEPGAIVRVPSFKMLDGALDTGLRDMGIDVDTIVLDRAIDEERLLAFLCRLMSDFRGDVLAIQSEALTFLSTPSPRGDGRFIYRLDPNDVDFYLFARFGATSTSFKVASQEEH